jgi:competence protein ComEC
MKRFLFTLLISSFVGWWIFSTTIPEPSSASLEMWMLDVGQGESVLVKEPSGKKLLFDGGPDDTVLVELGKVLPSWDHTLDLIILSHPHADHIRGLISILDRYSVHEVWSSGTTIDTADFRAWKTTLDQHNLTPRSVFAGVESEFGTAHVQVYFPLQSMDGKQPENAHDGDVVAKITTPTASLLLTGDLNEEHETALVQSCTPPLCNLHALVMQVPHHGSASGLIPSFLTAVHPAAALIPVGVDNIFHHPRPEILARLTTAKIPLFRTDTDHQIHASFENTSATITTGSGKQVTVTEISSSVPP